MLQKPILLYDGICNLCIRLIRFLEPMNQSSEGGRVMFVPFQKAEEWIARFNLSPSALQATLHFIDRDGKVYVRGKAIEKLSEYFPLLRIGGAFFSTELGEALYKVVAQNRYEVFGCADECYVAQNPEKPPARGVE
ncbi:MAG: DUF393 domain-containing protein [Chloroherpetonaceae bacterium]|nr:DUF393 domain-containing protein [Chloroherpetonaceae bacterium]